MTPDFQTTPGCASAAGMESESPRPGPVRRMASRKAADPARSTSDPALGLTPAWCGQLRVLANCSNDYPPRESTVPVSNVQRVRWYVPYGSMVRRNVADLRDSRIAGWAFWVRLGLIGAGLSAAAITAALMAFPGASFPWARLVLTPVVGLAFLAIAVAFAVLAPCCIEVRRGWIQVSRGQHASRIAADRIGRVELVEAATGCWHLVVKYKTTSGRERTVDEVVSPKVDLMVLASLVSDLAATGRAAFIRSGEPVAVSSGPATRSSPPVAADGRKCDPPKPQAPAAGG